jgi:hypothetical protein
LQGPASSIRLATEPLAKSGIRHPPGQRATCQVQHPASAWPESHLQSPASSIRLAREPLAKSSIQHQPGQGPLANPASGIPLAREPLATAQHPASVWPQSHLQSPASSICWPQSHLESIRGYYKQLHRSLRSKYTRERQPSREHQRVLHRVTAYPTGLRSCEK